MKKVAKLLKHNKFLFFLYRNIFSFIFRFIGIFVRTNNKLVLFVSYGGDSFNDSPKVLFDSMKADPYFADYTFVWSLCERAKIEGASVVKMDSMKYFITALKAKVWITNVNIERGLRFKKKKTIYLNTWHGTGPKKSGRAIKGRKDYDFSNVDILCVDGEYTKKHFIASFNANESSMLWCGRPREDKLFEYKQSQISSIKNKIGLSKDKKIVFYVPTWRENNARLLDVAKLSSLLGPYFTILVRTHHFSDEVFDCTGNSVVNVTSYPDISDLYLISDYLISDYSSAFFDFGLLKRPYYCFATDYDEYVINPGLFIDIKKEFVGSVFNDETKLAERIKGYSYLNESELCYRLCKKYIEIHKNATLECIKSIKQKLDFKG